MENKDKYGAALLGESALSANQAKLRNALEAELNRRRPIVSRLRQYVLGLDGNVPDSLRLRIWRNLLGLKKAQMTSNNVQTASINRASEHELENQRVIHADVLRTRAHDPLFQSDKTQNLIEALLVYWCQRKGVKYKQGLNEVLAPFVWVASDDPTLSRSNYNGIIFELFYAFVDKVLPSMFVEEDFATLQICHSLFQILLRFHDAELAARFKAADLSPELYSTPWFLTAFAHCIKTKEALLSVWDHCLLRSSRVPVSLFLHFIGLSLLFDPSNRKRMLEVELFELPGVVVKLPFGSTNSESDAISEIVTRAEKILSVTPISFIEMAQATIEEASLRAGKVDVDGQNTKNDSLCEIDTLYSEISCAMLIRGEEIARWLDSEHASKSYSGPHYFFLDVRSDDEYHFGGHFATSFHVNPIMLEEQHHPTLRASVAGFKDMSQGNFCLCVLGSSADDGENVEKLALLLSVWGFNRITKSYYDEVLLQMKPDTVERRAVVLISDKEEAARANTALAELLSRVSLNTISQVTASSEPEKTGANESTSSDVKKKGLKRGDTSHTGLDDIPTAPSATKPWSFSMAKNYAKKGATALFGGISGIINRVAPRQLMLSPSSWEKRMHLYSEEVNNEDFAKFHIVWIGPKDDSHPSEQILLVTPNFLVFLAELTSPENSLAKGFSADAVQQSTENVSFEVLNKYPLAQLRKISSRKKEPRMLIITFNAKDLSQYKVGFLTLNREETQLCIGLVKTHFIRITQVET